LDLTRVDVFLGDVWVAEAGAARAYDENAARQELLQDPVRIRVNLNSGPGVGWMWTCDLTHGYVDINAHYRS
jgi:glutamate N-acetyltransferase/amino-acid N-acetyltransferase